MAWYWWVLIAIGVVALGILKLKVWKHIQEKRRKRQEALED